MDDSLREDFPIDWDEDNYVTRRELFRFLAVASGGLALGSAAVAVWASIPKQAIRFDPVKIGPAKDMPVGGAVEFRFPRPHDLCLLLQPKEGDFVAYSRRCTHLSCPVEYQREQNRLYCPCHNGAFALDDGHVLQGPPPRALPQILLQVIDGDVYAVGVKET